MKNVIVSLTVLGILSGSALASGRANDLGKPDTCIAKFTRWPANKATRVIKTVDGVNCTVPLTAFQRLMKNKENYDHGGNRTQHESRPE